MRTSQLEHSQPGNSMTTRLALPLNHYSTCTAQHRMALHLPLAPPAVPAAVAAPRGGGHGRAAGCALVPPLLAEGVHPAGGLCSLVQLSSSESSCAAGLDVLHMCFTFFVFYSRCAASHCSREQLCARFFQPSACRAGAACRPCLSVQQWRHCAQPLSHMHAPCLHAPRTPAGPGAARP